MSGLILDRMIPGRFVIQTYQQAFQAVLFERMASLLAGRQLQAGPASESAAFLIGRILGDGSSDADPLHWMERMRLLLESAKAPAMLGPDLTPGAVRIWIAEAAGDENPLINGMLACLSEDVSKVLEGR